MRLGSKTLKKRSGVPDYRENLHYASILSPHMNIVASTSEEVYKGDKLSWKELQSILIEIEINDKRFTFQSKEELLFQLQK